MEVFATQPRCRNRSRRQYLNFHVFKFIGEVFRYGVPNVGKGIPIKPGNLRTPSGPEI